MVLALPLSRLLSDMVGESIMNATLSYTFSTEGTMMWLAVIILLSTLASFWPAKSASRVTVREVLAYE
jgi:putative ABC transport system permease protein